MKVHAVLGIYDGVLTDIEVHSAKRKAARRELEIAREYGLADTRVASNDHALDIGPEIGSLGVWHHHWSDDQRDVIVAECDVE